MACKKTNILKITIPWTSKVFFFALRQINQCSEFTSLVSTFAHETREIAHETSFFVCSRNEFSRNEFFVAAHETSFHETSFFLLLTKRVFTKRVFFCCSRNEFSRNEFFSAAHETIFHETSFYGCSRNEFELVSCSRNEFELVRKSRYSVVLFPIFFSSWTCFLTWNFIVFKMVSRVQITNGSVFFHERDFPIFLRNWIFLNFWTGYFAHQFTVYYPG